MYVNEHGETPGFKAFAIDGLFEVREAGEAGAPTAAGGDALRRAIEDVRSKVSEAIADGANLIVLSDRNATVDWAPIPSLLLTAAIHHHLVREKTRTKVGLVIETGDAREVHHMALLIGYGAAAVNPYLALDSIDDMIAEGLLEGVSPRQARRNYIKAACKGVLKVMSKMGISTVASYTGAQVFEAIGLDRAPHRRVLHRDVQPHRGRGALRAGGRGGHPAPACPRAAPDRTGPPRARGGRRVPVAARG